MLISLVSGVKLYYVGQSFRQAEEEPLLGGKKQNKASLSKMKMAGGRNKGEDDKGT